MKHLWSVLCSRAIVDEGSRSFSLIDVIDEVELRPPAEPVTPERALLVPVQWSFVDNVGPLGRCDAGGGVFSPAARPSRGTEGDRYLKAPRLDIEPGCATSSGIARSRWSENSFFRAKAPTTSA